MREDGLEPRERSQRISLLPCSPPAPSGLCGPPSPRPLSFTCFFAACFQGLCLPGQFSLQVDQGWRHYGADSSGFSRTSRGPCPQPQRPQFSTPHLAHLRVRAGDRPQQVSPLPAPRALQLSTLPLGQGWLSA